MCGIVGYIGEKSAKEILVSGLKNLEYRGYDSSGIAFKKSNHLEVIKSVGKIKNLEEKLKGGYNSATIGLMKFFVENKK